MYKTMQFRIKNLDGELNRQARAVNFVWNFANNTQKHALAWSKRWPSAYDLMKLTTGSSVELGIQADTINVVCAQYATSRAQKKRQLLGMYPRTASRGNGP